MSARPQKPAVLLRCRALVHRANFGCLAIFATTKPRAYHGCGGLEGKCILGRGRGSGHDEGWRFVKWTTLRPQSASKRRGWGALLKIHVKTRKTERGEC